MPVMVLSCQSGIKMKNDSTTSPIRVCFVMPKAYPLFNSQVKAVFGGAEVDLYLLATELARDKNFAASCVVADYGQPAVEVRENVTLIKSLNFKKNLPSRTASLWHAMRKADAAIYLQKAVSWGTFFVAMFCKIHKKAFIYRTATAGECDGSWPKKFFEQKAFRFSLKQADLVLTQNITDRDNLRSTTGIVAKAIPNGHILVPPDQCLRDTILWVGRSDKIKRPEIFIELAEQMPDEKFTMICQRATGDDEYDELIARASQAKNLEFIERVPFAEVDNFFQRAKIFVNTSDFEGFPNTFIQACKCGVSILSLNVNPDDFLNRYKCGLYAKGDRNTFKSMLSELLAGGSEEYGRNARLYAEQNHDIKRIIEQYKEMFYKLAGYKLQDAIKCAE
jgi:glycosyltransferase involved in cell wall biosynthesis